MLQSECFVSIRGILGAGKSCLARRLSNISGITYNPEPLDKYKYLEHAYQNPNEFALLSQVDIFDNIASITDLGGVMDQSLEDIVFVYSPLLLTTQDQSLLLQKYLDYKLRTTAILKPTLTVFLIPNPKEIHQRILNRGRRMEQQINYEYVNQLSQLLLTESKLYNDDQKFVISTSDVSDSTVEELVHRIYSNAA